MSWVDDECSLESVPENIVESLQEVLSQVDTICDTNEGALNPLDSTVCGEDVRDELKRIIRGWGATTRSSLRGRGPHSDSNSQLNFITAYLEVATNDPALGDQLPAETYTEWVEVVAALKNDSCDEIHNPFLLVPILLMVVYRLVLRKRR